MTTLVEEGSMQKDDVVQFQKTLNMRKGKSKKDITSFIHVNPCFNAYCTQIMVQIDTKKFDDQAALMVKDFIIHPEK